MSLNLDIQESTLYTKSDADRKNSEYINEDLVDLIDQNEELQSLLTKTDANLVNKGDMQLNCFRDVSSIESLHSRELYNQLPVGWEGAPQFQWRVCLEPEDRCLLIIQNVAFEDLFHPWIYPVMLRAQRTITDFSRMSSGKKNLGEVGMYFLDDHPISTAVLSHLIHVRIPQRCLKVFIPFTKWMLKYSSIIEERCGLIREPVESMKYLVLKPVAKSVDQNIIKDVFKNHSIENTIFETDAVGQRCAILKFATATRAIAAHALNNFVPLGDDNRFIRVLFAYEDIRKFGLGLLGNAIKPVDLLTHSELKENQIFIDDVMRKRTKCAINYYPKAKQHRECHESINNNNSEKGSILPAVLDESVLNFTGKRKRFAFTPISESVMN
ncbi:unnamed protein product [Dracunculus medinensis]|uniref:RRM domain-containing protein n=1 Tax=Dracunculus medinensis TaxID=318479 RepID=A0A0N4UGK7_DRAME|nr:unnamed protein product [Dracunculus medinensis]